MAGMPPIRFQSLIMVQAPMVRDRHYTMKILYRRTPGHMSWVLTYHSSITGLVLNIPIQNRMLKIRYFLFHLRVQQEPVS